MAETPTYYMTQERGGAEVFHCLVCESQQLEHHSADPELFAMHMAQRHDGRMVSTPGGQKPEEPAAEPEAPPEEMPAPPPGETGAPFEPAPPPSEPAGPEEGV
jgi:hypothetical protein